MRRRCRTAGWWVLGIALATACAGAPPRGNVLNVQRELARELIRRHEWSRALDVTDGLCRSAPKDADAHHLRGIVYMAQRMDGPAEVDLTEAVRLDSRHAAAHSSLGVLYDRQHRPGDGLEHHRRAAELKPGNPGYANNYGFSLFAHGRPREAVAVLREALRLAPTDARIRNNLGFAWAATGDLTRASAEFDLGGTPAQAKNNLGWAYEQRGLRERALELYAEATVLDPAATTPRENLDRLAIELTKATPPAP